MADTPKRQRRSDVFLFGHPEERILRALHRYHFLTAKQVCRLLYSPASLTFVRARLKALTDTEYLRRNTQPRATRFGRLPEVYTLDRRGRKYLASLGLDLHDRFRPSEVDAVGFHLLAHTLAINDFLIAAELLAASTPQLTLSRLLHDFTLKRTPTRVVLPDGKTTSVVPDAWLDVRLLHAGETHQYPLSLELDRGTRERKSWQNKVRALISFAGEPYQQAFGTSFLTILVVATPGRLRRDELLSWTEAVIGDKTRPEADLFRFSHTLADQVGPEDLFFSPIWLAPFTRSPVPLLSPPEGRL